MVTNSINRKYIEFDAWVISGITYFILHQIKGEFIGIPSQIIINGSVFLARYELRSFGKGGHRYVNMTDSKEYTSLSYIPSTIYYLENTFDLKWIPVK